MTYSFVYSVPIAYHGNPDRLAAMVQEHLGYFTISWRKDKPLHERWNWDWYDVSYDTQYMEFFFQNEEDALLARLLLP